MNNSTSWRSSTVFGRVCGKIGSIKLAIPVLTFVTGAMMWGTWIESTTSGENARARVYGSWWFIILMAMICVILVAAVITRYPWKRRHTGFIVVHASMITLIIGSFWSLFERVEGQMWLQEGMTGSVLETSWLQIEALSQTDGQVNSVAYALIDPASTSASLAGITVQIVDHWANTAEHRDVLNDGANPLQAIEVMLDPSAAQGLWIGQTLDGQPWLRLQALQIRVMPLGSRYTPPDTSAQEGDDYTFVVNDQRVPVPEVGDELLPGWTVESIRRFRHATVTAEGLTEGADDHDNPAIEIILDDGKGTLERHVAYKDFPDMKIQRPIQGEAISGVVLEAPSAGGGERIVFESIEGTLQATHIALGGEVRVVTQTEPLPWTVQLSNRSITIRKHFDRARAASHLIEAPASDRARPAIVIRVEGGADEDIPLRWKNPTTVVTPLGTLTLQYGPHRVALPFSIKLDDFRKIDYPGSDMAMAYESDVQITVNDKTESHLIYMNNPYKHGGWKVYQSGYDGDAISVFSIMKDPGLPLTYVGCIGVCVGIFLTFYAGGLSWGHPGIPVPFTQREKSNALQSDSTRHSFSSNNRDRAAMDRNDLFDTDAAQGTNHAGGHLRQGSGGESDGTVTMVRKARV